MVWERQGTPRGGGSLRRSSSTAEATSSLTLQPVVAILITTARMLIAQNVLAITLSRLQAVQWLQGAWGPRAPAQRTVWPDQAWGANTSKEMLCSALSRSREPQEGLTTSRPSSGAAARCVGYQSGGIM